MDREGLEGLTEGLSACEKLRSFLPQNIKNPLIFIIRLFLQKVELHSSSSAFVQPPVQQSNPF